VTTLLSMIADVKRSGDPSTLADAIPYHRFLGLELATDHLGLFGRLRYAEHLVGNPSLPALHGGVIGALLESTAIFELIWAQETVVLPKTITMTFGFLRSARPLDTLARATITRRGRRVATVRAVAWQEDPDRPVATANGQFLVHPATGLS
jgi:acyl-coenzyme A thioesterase PaaI-like protein